MATAGSRQKKPAWAETSGKSGRSGRRYRARRKNLFSKAAIVMCIFVVMLVIAVNAMSMRKKIAAFDVRIRELETEIAKEQERAVKIEEFRKYTQTKGYVEEIAQNILGLVYENEILFKQE